MLGSKVPSSSLRSTGELATSAATPEHEAVMATFDFGLNEQLDPTRFVGAWDETYNGYLQHPSAIEELQLTTEPKNSSYLPLDSRYTSLHLDNLQTDIDESQYVAEVDWFSFPSTAENASSYLRRRPIFSRSKNSSLASFDPRKKAPTGEQPARFTPLPQYNCVDAVFGIFSYSETCSSTNTSVPSVALTCETSRNISGHGVPDTAKRGDTWHSDSSDSRAKKNIGYNARKRLSGAVPGIGWKSGRPLKRMEHNCNTTVNSVDVSSFNLEHPIIDGLEANGTCSYRELAPNIGALGQRVSQRTVQGSTLPGEPIQADFVLRSQSQQSEGITLSMSTKRPAGYQLHEDTLASCVASGDSRFRSWTDFLSPSFCHQPCSLRREEKKDDKMESRKFACDDCPQKFVYPKDLKRHRLTHKGGSTDARKYPCTAPECRAKDVSFLRKDKLDSHTRTVHKRERSESDRCDLCGTSFGSAHDLRRHKACKHNIVEEVYRCGAPDCKKKDKEWKRRDNLKCHIEKQHPGMDVDLVMRSHGYMERQLTLPRPDYNDLEIDASLLITEQLPNDSFSEFTFALGTDNCKAESPRSCLCRSSLGRA